jgi:hypothetical protein
VLVIIENTADYLDALFGLFAFLLFEEIWRFLFGLYAEIGVENYANVVDDFFEQLLDGFEIVNPLR